MYRHRSGEETPARSSRLSTRVTVITAIAIAIFSVIGLRLWYLQVLSGDDAFTLAVMAHGGEGVISVCANQVPGPMHQLCAAAARGDFASARTIHDRLLKLMNLNFVESNPIPVKASMALLGLCEEVYRLPMVPPTEATREALRGALRELGLLP